LLNISPDHLDRYENYAAYAASKFSLFSNQKSSDLAILNYDDPEIRMRLDEAFLSGRIYSYGHEKYPGKVVLIAQVRPEVEEVYHYHSIRWAERP